jgi:biopolymer transport protein ExbB
MTELWRTIVQFMERGGLVMWPLALLSVVGLTLIFERCWFWIVTNNPGRKGRYRRVAAYLRQGKTQEASALIEDDRSVYARLVRQLLAEGLSDAAATEAIEAQRHRMDRYMTTLSTIITAAPMFGILGTVTGIISAFNILAETQTATDPSKISAGIAEALLTTVAGLVIALTVLFPYNAFRAQIDRTLSLMDSLVAAMEHGLKPR